MKETITMMVDTTAAHGGTYITDSRRPLTATHEIPGGPVSITADVVMDIQGHLELAWRANADDSYLGEDGDGLPADLLVAWAEEVRAMAHEHDTEALHELADYIEAGARAAQGGESD